MSLSLARIRPTVGGTRGWTGWWKGIAFVVGPGGSTNSYRYPPSGTASIEGRGEYVPVERYEQLMDVLKHRQAVRGYEDTPVEREKLNKILEAARWAPSGANSQPWEFIVIEDEDLIWEIGDTYVQAYDEKFMDNVPKFPVDNKRWHREPPAYIVVLGDKRARQAYLTASMEGEEMANAHTYLVSIGCAMYAMWLAATTLGLSTTMATCLSVHEEGIREILVIPDHMT